MALRLFPQVARSLRPHPVGARAISRSPEQLGIFDWITKRAQPQEVPNASPHSSQQPKADDEQSAPTTPPPAAAETPSAPSPATGPSTSAQEQSPATSSAQEQSPASADPPSSAAPSSSSSSSSASASASPTPPSQEPTSTPSPDPPIASAPSSSSDTTGAPANTPVPVDLSAFTTPAGVKVTSSVLPPAPSPSSSSTADVQPYTPPPAPPKPPAPPADERWMSVGETRKAQLHAQNARAGTRYVGRTVHFRPGDVSRAIGEVQRVVRTNNIRTEMVRSEYFEANPEKRWRKKRQFWADYITVGMRKNVQMVKILRDRNQLPRRLAEARAVQRA